MSAPSTPAAGAAFPGSELLDFLENPSVFVSRASSLAVLHAASDLAVREPAQIAQTTAADMAAYIGRQRSLARILGGTRLVEPGDRVLLTHRAGAVLDGLLAEASPAAGSLAGRLRSGSAEEVDRALHVVANMARMVHGIAVDPEQSAFERDLDVLLGERAFLWPAPVHLDATENRKFADALERLHEFPQYYRADFSNTKLTGEFVRLASAYAAADRSGRV